MNITQLEFDRVFPGLSQSHLTTLAALNHPANDITFVMQTIARADHKLLFQAGNEAYIKLYRLYTGQKAELEASK